MWNRWLGITFTSLMLVANAALFSRDVFPAWFASDAPASAAFDLQRGQVLRVQTGIFDSRGARVGTNWSESMVSGEGAGERVRSKSRTQLRLGGVLPGAGESEIIIRTQLTFLRGGQLEEIDLYVGGLLADLALRGERFAAGDFPVKWSFGEQQGSFMLSGSAGAAIGDVIRPFNDLPGLFVGRSWRIQVFNPLAHLASDAGPRRAASDAILARVAAEEDILHRAQTVRVFRVEAPRLRAWVEPSGRVLRQEVDVPVIGRLTLLEEPYEEAHNGPPVRRRGPRS